MKTIYFTNKKTTARSGFLKSVHALFPANNSTSEQHAKKQKFCKNCKRLLARSSISDVWVGSEYTADKGKYTEAQNSNFKT